MKNILLTLTSCFILTLTASCGASSPVNAPASSSDAPANSAKDYARTLVALDRGQKMLADVDDIDVKRINYLFGVLTYQTKQPVADIANGVDHASEKIENSYGRKVTRQQLLEDMANAYSKKLLGNVEGQPFKDVVLIWATMKYSK